MQTSEADIPGRKLLPAVLLAANLLLFAAWPWLRGLPVAADSTDRPFQILGEGRSARRSLHAEAVLRNPAYLAAFFHAVREERSVLYLGTSETLPRHNLGAQLNALYPQDPRMAVLARMGSSPIHSSLLFASCQETGIATPPLVLVINLVYFTESHDVINDGWMSSLMRSDVFVQMDHRGVLRGLSPEVRRLYEEHFGLKRLLRPLIAQEYLGSLAYLAFHQAIQPSFSENALPVGRFVFDGSLPDYDRVRGVHVDFHAVDRFAKGRWSVKAVDECNNLRGLESIAANLDRQAAPALFLVLPVNRRYYEANGLDMREFDRRYRAIREEISRLEKPGHLFVLDLYDTPSLDLGFVDRMHLDAYGYHQIADHLGQDATYRGFVTAVRAYYGAQGP